MPRAPLNAAYTFAAAARTTSFIKAAQELGVTPAAVSRSVKDLERILGVPLFERHHQGVSLTAAGRLYQQKLGGAFEQIAAATYEVIAFQSAEPLHVAAFPAVVMRCLIPSWNRFRKMNPGVEVRFHTLREALHTAPDFRRDGIDAAIFTRIEGVDGLVCEPLFMMHLVPVCSPKLCRGARSISRLNDLRHHTRLCATTRPEDWSRWFDAAGVAEVSPKGVLELESAMIVIQAAIEGLGIAVGIRELLQPEFASGALVCPFADYPDVECQCFLVAPKPVLAEPRFNAVRNWLMANPPIK